MEKKSRTKKPITCSICNLPSEVVYYEENKQGKIERHTHFPPCLGHSHLHPSLWNGSSTQHSEESQKFLRVITFDDYEKARVRRGGGKDNE